MSPKPAGTSSTEKAIRILLAFAPYNSEMGTVEISDKLGLHKSTVSRLLGLLKRYDFLQQNPDTKKYCLGRAAVSIGNAAVQSLNSNIVNIAQPYLAELCEATGESVALELLSGTDVILACHVEGQQHIRFTFKLGEQVPLNVAAGAKSILAFSDDALVARLLKNKFVRFNQKTIVTREKYRDILKEVRRTGIAYDRGERFEDSYAIATPIFNHAGQPVAAVVIAGPAFRITPQFLKKAAIPLKKTAAAISQRLFY